MYSTRHYMRLTSSRVKISQVMDKHGVISIRSHVPLPLKYLLKVVSFNVHNFSRKMSSLYQIDAEEPQSMDKTSYLNIEEVLEDMKTKGLVDSFEVEHNCLVTVVPKITVSLHGECFRSYNFPVEVKAGESFIISDYPEDETLLTVESFDTWEESSARRNDLVTIPIPSRGISNYNASNTLKGIVCEGGEGQGNHYRVRFRDETFDRYITLGNISDNTSFKLSVCIKRFWDGF